MFSSFALPLPVQGKGRGVRSTTSESPRAPQSRRRYRPVRAQRRRCAQLPIPLKGGPLKGRWAFPGGLVRVGEILDDAARRQLQTSHRTARGLPRATFYLRRSFARSQLACGFGRIYGTHPRSGAVRSPQGDERRGQWFEVSALPPLAYDHSLMAEYALKRLKAKLEYTNIAYICCPGVYFRRAGRTLRGDSESPDRSAKLPPPNHGDGYFEEGPGNAARGASAGLALQFRAAEPANHRNAIVDTYL